MISDKTLAQRLPTPSCCCKGSYVLGGASQRATLSREAIASKTPQVLLPDVPAASRLLKDQKAEWKLQLRTTQGSRG